MKEHEVSEKCPKCGAEVRGVECDACGWSLTPVVGESEQQHPPFRNVEHFTTEYRSKGGEDYTLVLSNVFNPDRPEFGKRFNFAIEVMNMVMELPDVDSALLRFFGKSFLEMADSADKGEYGYERYLIQTGQACPNCGEVYADPKKDAMTCDPCGGPCCPQCSGIAREDLRVCSKCELKIDPRTRDEVRYDNHQA